MTSASVNVILKMGNLAGTWDLGPGASSISFSECRSCNVINGRSLAYSYTAGPRTALSSTSPGDLGAGTPGAVAQHTL